MLKFCYSYHQQYSPVSFGMLHKHNRIPNIIVNFTLVLNYIFIIMIEPQKGHSIRKTDFKTQYIVLSTRVFCLYMVCQITFYPFWGRIIIMKNYVSTLFGRPWISMICEFVMFTISFVFIQLLLLFLPLI